VLRKYYTARSVCSDRGPFLQKYSVETRFLRRAYPTSFLSSFPSVPLRKTRAFSFFLPWREFFLSGQAVGVSCTTTAGVDVAGRTFFPLQNFFFYPQNTLPPSLTFLSPPFFRGRFSEGAWSSGRRIGSRMAFLCSLFSRLDTLFLADFHSKRLFEVPLFLFPSSFRTLRSDP